MKSVLTTIVVMCNVAANLHQATYSPLSSVSAAILGTKDSGRACGTASTRNRANQQPIVHVSSAPFVPDVLLKRHVPAVASP